MLKSTVPTKYLPVIIEMDEDGVFIVSCPLFKGCHSFGNTQEDALENLKEVIEMCLEEDPSPEMNRYIGFKEVAIA